VADTQKPDASGESKLFLQKLRLAVGSQTLGKSTCVLGASSCLSLLYPACMFLKSILLHAVVARQHCCERNACCSGQVLSRLMLRCSMLCFQGVSHCWKTVEFWEQAD